MNHLFFQSGIIFFYYATFSNSYIANCLLFYSFSIIIISKHIPMITWTEYLSLTTLNVCQWGIDMSRLYPREKVKTVAIFFSHSIVLNDDWNVMLEISTSLIRHWGCNVCQRNKFSKRLIYFSVVLHSCQRKGLLFVWYYKFVVIEKILKKLLPLVLGTMERVKMYRKIICIITYTKAWSITFMDKQ